MTRKKKLPDGPIEKPGRTGEVWSQTPAEPVLHPLLTGPYGEPLAFEWIVHARCPVCGAGLCAFSDPRPDVDRSIRVHCSKCDYEGPRASFEVEVTKCGT